MADEDAPKQRILFLYLETGGGHVTLARILAEKTAALSGAKPAVRAGFGKHQVFLRALFVRGYHVTSMIARGAYSLFYDANTLPLILRFTTFLVNWRTSTYLERLILKEKAEKVVCLHFALCPAARIAIERVKRRIPLIVVVTDPFTAHPAWFLVRNARYAVFSEELKAHIERAFGITGARVFPFVLKDEFSRPSPPPLPSPPAPPRGDFRVLITGGGEGLPGMARLVRRIIREETRRAGGGRPLSLTVVCGANRASFRAVSALARRAAFPVTVRGFAGDMPSLIAASDCIVTKAGASLTMEILSMHKPFIISTYIHGQELGNVRYAVKSGAGWFIQKPAGIYRALRLLADDPRRAERAARNARRLAVKNGAEELAAYILSAD